jgi:hypothetical protein
MKGVSLLLLVVYLSAALLLMTAFCVTDKKLHLFEILSAWMAVSSIAAVLSSYFMVNMKVIVVPDGREEAVVRIINMLVLTPLIVVWIMDRVEPTGKWALRWIGYLSIVVLLLLCGYLLFYNHVVRFVRWGWLAFAVKDIILPVAAFLAICVVRYLMRKDEAPHEPVPH